MPEAPIERIVDIARQAEAAGFEAVWIFDEGLVTRDVYVTLAAIALATERIKIGTGITNPYTRHPAVTANAIASLDELSNGRAFVGLGAGGGLTLTPLAIERKRPLVATREMVEILRALFAHERVDYHGETVALNQASIGWGRSEIEIWVAGRGPRMLDQAGRIADGVHLSYLHKSTIGDSVAAVRSASSSNSPKLSLATALVTNDEQLTQARTQLTFRLLDSPDSVRARIGLGEDDVAQIREALNAGGPPGAAHLIKEEWVSEFAIMGSPAECRSELRSLMRVHGLDEFQVPILDPAMAENILATAASVLG